MADKKISATHIRSQITSFDVEKIASSNIKTIQVLGNVSSAIEKKTKEEIAHFDKILKALEALPRNQLENNRQQQKLFLGLAKLTATLERRNEKHPNAITEGMIEELYKEGKNFKNPTDNEPKSLKESLAQKHFGLEPSKVREQGFGGAYKDQFKKDVGFILGKNTKPDKNAPSPFELQVNTEKVHQEQTERIGKAMEGVGGYPIKNAEGTNTYIDTGLKLKSDKSSKATSSLKTKTIEPKNLTETPEPELEAPIKNVGEERKQTLEHNAGISKELEKIFKQIANDVKLIRLVVHDKVKLNPAGKGSKYVATESHGKVKAGDFVKDPDKGASVEGSVIPKEKRSGKKALGIESKKEPKEPIDDEGQTSGADIAEDKNPEGSFEKESELPQPTSGGGIGSSILGVGEGVLGAGAIAATTGGAEVAAGAGEAATAAGAGEAAAGASVLGTAGVIGGGLAAGLYVGNKFNKSVANGGMGNLQDTYKYAMGGDKKEIEAEKAKEQIALDKAHHHKNLEVPKSRTSEILERSTEEENVNTEKVVPPQVQNITPINNTTNNYGSQQKEGGGIGARPTDNSFVRFQNKRTSRVLQ